MAGNFFDQFDQRQTSGGNFFDQFDGQQQDFLPGISRLPDSQPEPVSSTPTPQDVSGLELPGIDPQDVLPQPGTTDNVQSPTLGGELWNSAKNLPSAAWQSAQNIIPQAGKAIDLGLSHTLQGMGDIERYALGVAHDIPTNPFNPMADTFGEAGIIDGAEKGKNSMEKAAGNYARLSSWWDKKIEKGALADELAGEVLASPIGIANFLMDREGLAFIKGISQGKTVGASAIDQVKVNAADKILHYAIMLELALRIVTLFGVGAAQSAAEGQGPRDTVKSGLAMAALAATGGMGGVSGKEVGRAIKGDINSLGKTIGVPEAVDAKKHIDSLPPEQKLPAFISLMDWLSNPKNILSPKETAREWINTRAPQANIGTDVNSGAAGILAKQLGLSEVVPETPPATSPGGPEPPPEAGTIQPYKGPAQVSAEAFTAQPPTEAEIRANRQADLAQTFAKVNPELPDPNVPLITPPPTPTPPAISDQEAQDFGYTALRDMQAANAKNVDLAAELAPVEQNMPGYPPASDSLPVPVQKALRQEALAQAKAENPELLGKAKNAPALKSKQEAIFRVKVAEYLAKPPAAVADAPAEQAVTAPIVPDKVYKSAVGAKKVLAKLGVTGHDVFPVEGGYQIKPVGVAPGLTEAANRKKAAESEAMGITKADPIYATVQAAKDNPVNLTQLKIDYPDIAEDLAKKFPFMFSYDGKMAPDEFADEQGYESLDSMVEALKAAQPISQTAAPVSEVPTAKLDELQAAGFVPVGDKLVAGNLRKGDKVIGRVAGGVQDEYTVLGRDSQGRVVMQGKGKEKVDLFDDIDVEFIKQGEDQENQEYTPAPIDFERLKDSLGSDVRLVRDHLAELAESQKEGENILDEEEAQAVLAELIEERKKFVFGDRNRFREDVERFIGASLVAQQFDFRYDFALMNGYHLTAYKSGGVYQAGHAGEETPTKSFIAMSLTIDKLNEEALIAAIDTKLAGGDFVTVDNAPVKAHNEIKEASNGRNQRAVEGKNDDAGSEQRRPGRQEDGVQGVSAPEEGKPESQEVTPESFVASLPIKQQLSLQKDISGILESVYSPAQKLKSLQILVKKSTPEGAIKPQQAEPATPTNAPPVLSTENDKPTDKQTPGATDKASPSVTTGGVTSEMMRRKTERVERLKKELSEATGDIQKRNIQKSLDGAEETLRDQISLEKDLKRFSPPSSQSPTPQKDKGEEKKPESSTDDVGRELSYNKRNRVAGLKWKDLADMDASLRVKEATKSKIHPRPDYQVLVDGGMRPQVAFVVKQAYDAIPAKPSKTTDEAIQQYIDAVDMAMGRVMAWAESDSSRQWLSSMIERARSRTNRGPVSILDSLSEKPEKSLLDTVFPGGWREQKQEAHILGNKFFAAIQPGLDDVVKAMKDIDKGWPGAVKAWQKQGYTIVDGDGATARVYMGDTEKRGKYASVQIELNSRSLIDYAIIEGVEKESDPAVQEYITKTLAGIHGKKLLLNKNKRMIGAYGTEAMAAVAAEEHTKRAGKEQTVSDKGISVEAASREGKQHRAEGENISTERLAGTFGFSGVNFGNWMKGKGNEKERQLHINHAFDSFMDLADVLGVPPRAMSLDGLLGIAIGAQGNGKYAAHFVPGVNEINLTRTSGAGSLAHEWAHALDHYFARQAGLGQSLSPFLTESPGRVKGEIRPEIVEHFKKIVAVMQKRQMTKEEWAERVKMADARTEKNITSWLAAIKRDMVSRLAEGVNVQVGGKNVLALGEIDRLIEKIKAGDVGEGTVQVTHPARRDSMATFLSPVVIELRNLHKTLHGRTPSLDNFKGLQSNIDSLKYRDSAEREKDTHIPQVSTQYLSDATHLDKEKGGKPYWSTEVELFARAFDAYVSDKLTALEARNTYLSHAGRDNETVPKGEERAAINTAFDTLVAELKTKETEKGTALYSESPPQPTGNTIAKVKSELSAILPPEVLGNKERLEVVQSQGQLPGHIGGFLKSISDKPESARQLKARLLTDLRRLQKENPDSTYGIRVFGEEQPDVKVGDILPNSWKWDDGNWTDEQYDGVAAFFVESAADAEAFLEAFSYSVGGNQRIGIVRGEGSFNHDMPERRAVLVEDAELVSLYDRPDDLKGVWNRKGAKEALLKPIYSKDGSIAGAFDPGSGKIWLVGDTIKPGEAVSIYVHEVTHREMREDHVFISRYDELGNQFAALRESDPKVAAAYARVPADTPAHLINEEAISYGAQSEANAKPGKGLGERARFILAKIMAHIRAWLNTHGFKLKLTHDDIMAMIQQGIKRDIKRSMVGQSEDVRGMVGEPALAASSNVELKAVDTESENFKKWFGDSKVVDAEGKPLRVFHGGSGQVTDFSRGSNRGSLGAAYLTDSRDAALKYAFLGGIDSRYGEKAGEYGAELHSQKKKGNPLVAGRKPALAQVFVSIQNPAHPDDVTSKSVIGVFGKDEVYRWIKDDSGLYDIEEHGDIESEGFDSVEDYLKSGNNLADYIDSEYDKAELKLENDHDSLGGPGSTTAGFNLLHLAGRIEDYMKGKGIDGWIFEDKEAGGTTYVPLSPTQIKSAISNSGAFNPASADIRYSKDDTGPLFSKPSEIITAANERLKKTDAFQTTKEALDFVSAAHDGLKKLYNPGDRSPAAKETQRAIIAGMGKVEAGNIKLREELDQAARDVTKRSGVRAKLQDIIDKGLTQAADALFTNMDHDGRVAFMQAMDTGDRDYFSRNPDSLQMAGVMKAAWEEKSKAIQDLDTGALQVTRENYFKHLWKDKKAAAGIDQQMVAAMGGGRTLEGKKSFTKRRVFEDIQAGLDAGYELLTDNPLDVFTISMAEMDKYILAHTTLKTLEGHQDDSVILLPAGESGPPGYHEVLGRYGTITRQAPSTEREFVQSLIGQGIPSDEAYATAKSTHANGGPYTKPEKFHYVMRDDVAQVVNNYLSPSLYNHENVGKLYTAYMGAANAMNSTQLGVSLFHAGFTSFEAVISHNALGIEALSQGHIVDAAKYFGTAPAAFITNPVLGDRIIKELRSPGANSELADIAEGLQLAGFKWKMDSRLRLDAHKRMLAAWADKKRFRAGVNGVISAVEQLTRPTLEWLVPRQKMGVFGEMYLKFLKDFPEATHEERRNEAQEIWNRVDSRLGQVVYERLMVRNASKNIIQALIRAPGWTGGTIFEVGGGLKDAANIADQIRRFKSGRGMSRRMAYVISLAMVHGLASAIMNKLSTDEWPTGWEDFIFSRTGNIDENGNPERRSLPTYMKDVYAYTRDLPDSLWVTLGHKTHPLLSAGSQIINNRDYYGTEIRNEDDSYLQQAGETAKFIGKNMSPFAIQGLMKERSRGGSISSQALPFIGITPAPSDINKSRAQILMSKYGADRVPQGSRTKVETDRAKLRGSIRNAFAKGDEEKAQTLFEAANSAGKMSIKEFHALRPRGDESDRRVESFKRLTYPQASRVWRLATDEEKQLFDQPYQEMYMKANTEDMARGGEGITPPPE